jgi:hypothetical protein
VQKGSVRNNNALFETWNPNPIRSCLQRKKVYHFFCWVHFSTSISARKNSEKNAELRNELRTQKRTQNSEKNSELRRELRTQEELTPLKNKRIVLLSCQLCSATTPFNFYWVILHYLHLCVCVNDNVGTNHWHDGSFLRFGCFCLLLLLYLPITTVFRV